MKSVFLAFAFAAVASSAFAADNGVTMAYQAPDNASVPQGKHVALLPSSVQDNTALFLATKLDGDYTITTPNQVTTMVKALAGVDLLGSLTPKEQTPVLSTICQKTGSDLALLVGYKGGRDLNVGGQMLFGLMKNGVNSVTYHGVIALFDCQKATWWNQKFDATVAVVPDQVKEPDFYGIIAPHLERHIRELTQAVPGPQAAAQ